MAVEGGLERVGLGALLVGNGLDVLDLPDFGRVVGAARGELLDVRREEDAGDVLLVGAEVGYGNELGAVVGLEELPDKDVALGGVSNVWRRQRRRRQVGGRREKHTALLAAHRREPSLATVTLDTDTSSSGISW